MTPIERAKELLLLIKSKQTQQFNNITQIPFVQIPFQQNILIDTKNHILNSKQIQDQQYDLNSTIYQQKQLQSTLIDLLQLLNETQKLFMNGLEDNCVVKGLIGLQSVGQYMIKEFEVLKKLKTNIHINPKLLLNKDNNNKQLSQLYEEKEQIEIIKILFFIKQKQLNEKIKHIKESMYNNGILIYDYGNIKKINTINSKLQIDGPIIQQQILEKLVNIKSLIKQKILLDLQEKQILSDYSQQQYVQQQQQYFEKLTQIQNRGENVRLIIQQEYQKLGTTYQELKNFNFDLINNSILENKNIIEYEKQQTKPLKFIEKNSQLGSLFKTESLIIDIDQVIKQLNQWCKNKKIIKTEIEISQYKFIIQCIEKLKMFKNIQIKDIDELRQQFVSIQKIVKF